MAFIVIKSTPLSAESKKRLGDRLLYALQAEGIKPGETVIRYEPEDSSVYMDGTLVDGTPYPKGYPEALTLHAASTFDPRVSAITNEALGLMGRSEWKSKPRRTQQELFDLKAKLIGLLRRDKSLSSFEATAKLDLKDCDWAPATLRRMFHELEESNQIRVEGQKRGTRYHWIVKEELPEAKLEKA